ncbi:unnamed protein product [Dracunculus medinensis]|uniref:Folliculin n=1 Tax=Dracunculus medinensis TaxID=318479 RepID=A0A0N4U320_DRAME|nr:unnamed protein product [Dracunculus medinensis]
MQTVIALCHFCENHGPRVVLTTQSVRNTSISEQFLLNSTLDPDYDHIDDEARCLACSSFLDGKGLISSDNKCSYISSQAALNDRVYNLLKNACLRSLSCEISVSTLNINKSSKKNKHSCSQFSDSHDTSLPSPVKDAWFEARNSAEKDGVVIFGDDEYGYSLSYTFRLRDSKARGLQRLFSLIAFSMDKLVLTSNYDFFVSAFTAIIEDLQSECLKNAPTTRSSHPPANLLEKQFPDLKFSGSARNLTTISGCPAVFTKLHKQISWILRMQTCLCIENIMEGLPNEDTLVEMEMKMDEVKKENLLLYTSNARENLLYFDALKTLAKKIYELGTEAKNDFLKFLLTQVVIGGLIILKCDNRKLADHFLLAIANLLPFGCVRLGYCTLYNECYRFNLCSCPFDMYLPQQNGFVSVSISTPGYMNGEVFKNGLNGEFSPDLSSFEEYESDSLNESKSGEADKFKYDFYVNTRTYNNQQLLRDIESCIFTNFVYPNSYLLRSEFPTVVSRYKDILLDKDLSKCAQEVIIKNTREYWLSKTKLFFQFNIEKMDLEKAIRIVKCTKSDLQVLCTWESGLSKSYKQSMLEAFNHSKTKSESGILE